MKRTLISVISSLVAAVLLSASTSAQTQWKEGEHYDVITPAVRVSADQVLEPKSLASAQRYSSVRSHTRRTR